jgi:hypothetical protein
MLSNAHMSRDILAELDLQPSGIEDLHKRSENGVPFPQIIPEEQGESGQPDRIMLYYSFQIHLRKTLNNIQPFLYPPDGKYLPICLEDDTYQPQHISKHPKLSGC